MGGAGNAKALEQWNNDEHEHRLAWVTSCSYSEWRGEGRRSWTAESWQQISQKDLSSHGEWKISW